MHRQGLLVATLVALTIAGSVVPNVANAVVIPVGVTGTGTSTDPFVTTPNLTPDFPATSYFDIFPEVGPISGFDNTDTIIQRLAPYEFPLAVTQKWFDPPIVNGFEYIVSSGTFISVQTPAGFGPVDVFVGNVDLGTIADGGSFTFNPSNQPSDFILYGLHPAVDAGNNNAYPVQLSFTATQPTLDVIPLEAVPEPASLSLLGLGLAGLGAVRRRLARR